MNFSPTEELDDLLVLPSCETPTRRIGAHTFIPEIDGCGDLLNLAECDSLLSLLEDAPEPTCSAEPSAKRQRIGGLPTLDLRTGCCTSPDARLFTMPSPTRWPLESLRDADVGSSCCDAFGSLPLLDATTSSETSSISLGSPRSRDDDDDDDEHSPFAPRVPSAPFHSLLVPATPETPRSESSLAEMPSLTATPAAAPFAPAAASATAGRAMTDAAAKAIYDESERAKQTRKTSLPWSAQEDAALRAAVEEQGPKKWSAIAALIGSRSGKQCRLRWCNQIDPNIIKEAWTELEDSLIIAERTKAVPTPWVEITKLLPGRPDNAIKNRWNGCLMRRVLGESARVKSKKAQAQAASCAASAGDDDAIDFPSRAVLLAVSPSASASSSASDSASEAPASPSPAPSPKSSHQPTPLFTPLTVAAAAAIAR